MKFINLLLCLILSTTYMYSASKDTGKKKLYVVENEDDYIDIDFKDLKIVDLIKFVSKVLNKNILLSQKVSGKIDFISTKPILRGDIVDILIDVLSSKGFTMVGNGDTIQIVRSTDAIKLSLPVIYSKSLKKKQSYKNKQMVTEFIDIVNENVDVVSSKIRHLASRYSKIVTNTNTNTLIITDYPSSIKMLKQAINIISRDQKKEIRTIQAKNIKLTSLISHVRKVVNAFYKTTIIPYRIAVIENRESNSLVLIGKKSQLDFIEKYAREIDLKATEPSTNESMEVIYLKNTEASKILSTVRGLISKRIKSKGSQKPYVASDNESNSIVLIGPKEDLRLIKDMINLLDKEKKQVYVNVKIIEISKKVSDKIGSKYGLEGGLLSGGGLLTFAMNLGGSSTASKLISASGVGKTQTQGAIIGAGVDFLVENSIAKVVSEPSIISINNKESSITVGETRSILTSSSTSSTTVNNSYKREDIGLFLKVKPRISNDKKVTLDITAKLEDVVEGTGGNGTPTTTKRLVKTTAIVRDGESVIVGGLVKRKKTQAIGGINFLSTIPLIGPLFGSHTDGLDNVNLVIIITPYIIDESSSLSGLRKNLAELDLIRQKYLQSIKERLNRFDEDFDLEDTN